MNSNNLVPISVLAKKAGAKVLLYGQPGTAKTPMVMALPNAVACVTETGLASVANSTMPSYPCYSFKAIDDFFKWFCNPNAKDVNKFDTLVIDSLTKMCDIILKHQLSINKHGQQAYGKMADYVMDIVSYLQAMPNKNIVFISQMATEEITIPGVIPGQVQTKTYNRPLFPGKVLIKKIPHEIDHILYVHKTDTPVGYGPAIGTVDTGEALARSRGTLPPKLNPIEPPDLNYIFSKLNS